MLALSAEQHGVHDCKLYCLTSAELGAGAWGAGGVNVLLIMFPVFILSCLSNWKGDFQTKESAKLRFFQKMPCSLHTSQTNMVQAANYTCVTTDKTGAKCSSSSFMSVHMIHPSIANQQATDEILHRVIPLQATSSKNPQISIKSETFLVSPISIVFDFLSRQCERVTGRESVRTRLAWLRKKTRYVIVVTVQLKWTPF